jgi:anthranilate synthase component I
MEVKEKIKLNVTHRKLLADTYTPVSIYLRIRDQYANSVLLESSDYHGNENSFSYIGCNPVASFKVQNGTIFKTLPEEETETTLISDKSDVMKNFREFLDFFEYSSDAPEFITTGLYGYISYNASQYFDDVNIQNPKEPDMAIPEMHYLLYRYVIAINHFNNELFLMDLYPGSAGDELDEIENLVKNRNFSAHSFKASGVESSVFTDNEFVELVKKGQQHCMTGDVFQIVLSRRFSRKFKGDEFNVYRALRSINPSPYLFFFDFGDFKIFGSSPEAQLTVSGNKASIFPIAGTFRRTGNDEADEILARNLMDDPKETSEHVMLVDLARNDLSRAGENVKVETFREIQFYSHVIHMVSKVTAEVGSENLLELVSSTFPAGTLSGAPKIMAMNLIDKYEKVAREYYGGAIGIISFDGRFNHAIMIRSFLSRNNTLFYQAGAGVVAKSVPENELQEVNNKLEALRKAINLAETI